SKKGQIPVWLSRGRIWLANRCSFRVPFLRDTISSRGRGWYTMSGMRSGKVERVATNYAAQNPAPAGSRCPAQATSHSGRACVFVVV
ncbi:hypothetical protein E4U54_007011, partial [Claviceps lovelessii]